MYSRDPQYIVNGIALGPSAVVIWVDYGINKDAYLWRPTSDMSCIGDAVGKKIAWPESKVEVSNESVKETVNCATSFLKSKPVLIKPQPVSINSQITCLRKFIYYVYVYICFWN